MVAERFRMHSDLKTEAQKMLNSYLAASALHGEWRFGGPAELLRARRAVQMIRPSGNTTVSASTFSRIVP